jgi:tetratricopeptide (TPR) repeat protein
MTALIKNELVEPFDERVNRLFRELEQALKWNRPSILLAVYSSEFVRADAEAALSAKLHELGQSVTPYRVTGEENADIPLNLSQHPEKAKTVFFVSGLQWGGGKDGRNVYRALNIRREYFVDYLIRVVFWLTEKEAIALPNFAPDFWAFRHRVVEFVEAPEPDRIIPLAEEMAWRDWEDQAPREDTDARIALREALLTDLPEGVETMAARADLLYTLARLYRAKGKYEKSIELLQQSLQLAERLKNIRLQSLVHYSSGAVYQRLNRYHTAIFEYQLAIALDPSNASSYNGLGRVYRALGRYDEAIAACQQAIELDPKFAYPHYCLGNVYDDLRRYDEAIAEYQRAIELDPKYAYPHNGLGNVYRAFGRYNEAIAEYQRAIELDPKYAYPYNGLGNVYRDLGRYNESISAHQRAIELYPQYAISYIDLGNDFRALGRHEEAIAAYQHAIGLNPKLGKAHFSLAACYRKLGREAEYAEQIKIARKLIAQENEYNRACLESVCGNVDEALRLLKIALEKKQISSAWARRDPDFDFIRDDPRFKALVGE